MGSVSSSRLRPPYHTAWGQPPCDNPLCSRSEFATHLSLVLYLQDLWQAPPSRPLVCTYHNRPQDTCSHYYYVHKGSTPTSTEWRWKEYKGSRRIAISCSLSLSLSLASLLGSITQVCLLSSQILNRVVRSTRPVKGRCAPLHPRHIRAVSLLLLNVVLASRTVLNGTLVHLRAVKTNSVSNGTRPRRTCAKRATHTYSR